ncbi:DNA-binding PadR family transcriptional regulator [Streptomyces umbrinus]|uniref:DNA-binding PadR family transcriptional regulator n=1 Tax=Streptomyces umbrinus TaxID=67370 RepID=A0ABU0SG73_9ACTN|nr:PadR family transcriptional regulator [Streptomyces umbrinus]MDQ1022570.1 DNA-binding PadR family transcriptional regulator [Streptomyces umbrinus]
MDQERRKVSNPLALAVLAFLVQRPMHPYEMGRLLKERNLQQSIKYRNSSLYMVVEQLDRDGYIAPQQTSREGRRPERTTYTLTEAGRAELRDRMRDLVSAPVKEYPQFQAALALIVVLAPSEVPELLGRRRETLAEQSEEIRTRIDAARTKQVDRLFLIEHEYELALIEAERAFVRQLAELIQEDPPGFGVLWRDLHPDDRD